MMVHCHEFEARCPKCNRLLGFIYGHAEIKCPRCNEIIEISTDLDREPNIKIKKTKSAAKSTE